MAKRPRDAGTYDKFMVLQKKTETNTRGTVSKAWGDVADMWCSLWPLQGREYYASQQIQADVTHMAHTGWRDDVTPTSEMRLWMPDEDRTFEIRSVIDVEERHAEWEFRLVEAV